MDGARVPNPKTSFVGEKKIEIKNSQSVLSRRVENQGSSPAKRNSIEIRQKGETRFEQENKMSRTISGGREDPSLRRAWPWWEEAGHRPGRWESFRMLGTADNWTGEKDQMMGEVLLCVFILLTVK